MHLFVHLYYVYAVSYFMSKSNQIEQHKGHYKADSARLGSANLYNRILSICLGSRHKYLVFLHYRANQ